MSRLEPRWTSKFRRSWRCRPRRQPKTTSPPYSVVREVGIRLRDTGAVASCVELNALRCRRWLERAGALAPMRERAMARLQQASVRNRLLSALNPDDFGLLRPDLEPVALDLRQWLIEAGEPIQHVTFPEQGIVSILADTSEGRIEVGLIGPEGMAGLPVVLGPQRSRVYAWEEAVVAPREQRVDCADFPSAVTVLFS